MAPLGGLQQTQTTTPSTTSTTTTTSSSSGVPGIPGIPGIQQQRQQQFSQRDSNQTGVNNSTTQPQQPTQAQYSIPGILHFLQFEWQRFELERQQWNVERTELQARIALLQGERKGQDNLKNDLVRRIKMLEYCLKQERIKFHRLKFGTNPPGMEKDVTDEEDKALEANQDPLEGLMSNINNNLDDTTTGLNWKHGRQLLRQYLQEIGYTDTIIDVRSNRVRSLLGLNNMNNNNAVNLGFSTEDGEGGLKAMLKNNAIRRGNCSSTAASSIVQDTEASVLATFEFLNEQRDHHGGHNRDDEDEEEEDDVVDDGGSGGGQYAIDSETEEVLAEFDFLNTQSTSSSQGKHQRQQQEQVQDANWRSRIPDIGELANLTLNNESDIGLNGSVSASTANSSLTLPPDYRKTWNPRYILKSHFDCIRCLRFHPIDPLLVTCSEDETLKLWNLNKTQPSTKSGKSSSASASASGASTTFDLEPVHTFRGHTSKVLSLCLEDSFIFSGSQSGELFSWRLPDNTSNIDPYDPFDVSMAAGSFVGHTDAIWSLICMESKTGILLVVSVSADYTLKVWDVNRRECLRTITLKDSRTKPTCLAAIPSSNNCTTNSSGSSVVVSFADGSLALYDVDSLDNDAPVLSFEYGSSDATLTRINSVVCHPTLPVVVSAHEDRQIKFWDLNNGKCIHSMVAHLDEVTCLAVDPTGLFLLSGSHDCSVRLWNFDNRTCVQEITSHRKKFDESILDVSFHSSKSFFASAGADGLAKVFV